MIELPSPIRVLMDHEPLLRTASEPVAEEDFGAGLVPLLRAMYEVCFERGARGLAAVQIGVPVRVLLVRVDDTTFRPFINPELTRTLNRHDVKREGCLSILPHKWGEVSRPAKCDVTWRNPKGKQFSETLRGDMARIFQHEHDHLNGVLMTDHMPRRGARRAVGAL
jgi:peptide deformylase